MTVIRFGGEDYDLDEGESVLDCLTTGGATIPSSCRSGICQTCLMQAVSGHPPESAQKGLSEALRLQHHFLACICHPEENLEVTLPGVAKTMISATVTQLERLNKEILLVALRPQVPMDFRAGQYVNLLRDSGLSRSYSIASLPGDEEIHLHVRRQPGGQFSGWIHESLKINQTIGLRGPAGSCFYVPGHPEQPLLLVGTGSGLAPLYGIIRDALAQGHTGPIRLFHGSRHADGLYLSEELHALSARHSNFAYVPCVSGDNLSSQYATGRASAVAFGELPDLKGWRVFLCGHPAMVQQSQMQAFLAGASFQDIFVDAFSFTALPAAEATIHVPERA